MFDTLVWNLEIRAGCPHAKSSWSHFGGRDSRIVIKAIERQCILFLTLNRIFAYTTSCAWVLFLSIEDALNIYFISLQINYLRGE